MASGAPPSDHRTLERLEAELAAVRLELERRESAWQEQLRTAALVHASLLPRAVRHPSIAVEPRYIPVDDVGGDYCQVLFPDESLCYVTMCDVTGHGIGPALLATRVSSEVRRAALASARPRDIVSDLNAFVLRHFRETNLQLSFLALRFDLEERVLTYAGAGHPAPLLIRAGREDIESLDSQNSLLGVIEDALAPEPEGARALGPGDRLLIYTDGLSEARNAAGKALDARGLGCLVLESRSQPPAQAASHILDRVRAYRAGPPQDDTTLVLVEIGGEQPATRRAATRRAW